MGTIPTLNDMFQVLKGFGMILFLLLASIPLISSKIYDRCELARELKYVHEAPPHQLATWVCIAEHESQYNTSVVGRLSGDGSGDHGLFQISDKYWCSPPGKGYACGLTCAELEDDDITDDFICAQRIYKEHKQLSGDGFNAWAVYGSLCKGPKSERYIKDCFNEVEEPKAFAPDVSTPPSLPPVFAHRFFNPAAGRGNRYFPTSTERPTFDAFFTPRTTSSSFFPYSSSDYYTPTTSRTPSFFSTTSRPAFSDIPTTSFSPFASRSFFTPSSSRSTFFTPPSSTSTFFTPSSRSTFFKPPSSRSTFFTPSSSSSAFFSPTPSTSIYQGRASNSLVSEPVFIVNGVKWY